MTDRTQKMVPVELIPAQTWIWTQALFPRTEPDDDESTRLVSTTRSQSQSDSVFSSAPSPSTGQLSSTLSTSQISSPLTSLPPSSTTLALTTVTSSFAVTITAPSSTFVSFSETTFTSSVFVTGSPTSFPSSGAIAGVNQPICLGDGVDISVLGLLSVVVLPSVVGFVIWLIFAAIRPRLRQIYAVREWFAPQNIRPPALRDSFWAFLFPNVPFVPPFPDRRDVANSPNGADLPSDGQLSQRVLWVCLLIVLGWSLVGLAGALPLYLINTPCLAQSVPQASLGGIYSVLQDLSLLRLLQLLEDGQVVTQTSPLQARAVVDGNDVSSNIRTRLIILTVFAIVLVMLPALYKIMNEFNKLVEYRRAWLEVHCENLELGWLSASKAPSFTGWGEKRIKDLIVKIGLSGSLDQNSGIAPGGGLAGIGSGFRGRNRRRSANGEENDRRLNDEEKSRLEIDVCSLFSIGDTQHLANLIVERDHVLNQLEVAEARYISSFKLSTPEPSIAELPIPPEDENDIKRHISRPRALTAAPQYRTGRNRKHASVSSAPTSYVAPSQYYKLRGVRGIGSGLISPGSGVDSPSFGETVRSRVVGTRFQEVNRDSIAYEALPIGSRVAVNRVGTLGPMSQSYDATTLGFGPNHGTDPSSGYEGESAAGGSVDPGAYIASDSEGGPASYLGSSRIRDSPLHYGDLASTPTQTDKVDPPIEEDMIPAARRRPVAVPPERRETFPMREHEEAQVPPHLRLQPQQPFVRPLSGLDHDDLGAVYTDIREWRTRLKQINGEIVDAQNDCYNDIADGVHIKGWLITGKGIRHLPGIEMIEGRSKEDIIWYELQHGGGFWSWILFWAFVLMIAILLGAAFIAVAGLVVATAPGVANFLPLFDPLLQGNKLGSGLVTILVPVILATIFLVAAVSAVRNASKRSGVISETSARLMAYRATFFILCVVAVLWFTAVGAVIFSLEAFDASSGRPKSVANGSIYMSTFFLALIVNVAIITPGLLLLQPTRLKRVLWHERRAITPRQRFRAVYPKMYDPTYATACCIMAVILASTFSLIFPLIGPAVILLLFLTIVAHRFVVGYVYGRVDAQTGGLMQLWLLRRFATVVTFQPILLGLILLTRRLFVLGAISIGVAVLAILIVESYATFKLRLPGRGSLNTVTQDALDKFEASSRSGGRRGGEDEGTSLVSSHRARPRGSFASVLEMMSLTLAVMPTSHINKQPVPLETEALDDLTATERAARTHPDAPPLLPPLPFADHAEEMAGILYAPELIAPSPIIWLPNDSAGVARSEAYDLQRYHNLRTTLDVRSSDDVIPRRSSSSRTR